MNITIKNIDRIVDCVSEIRQLDEETARSFVSRWSEDELITADAIANSNEFRGVVSNICNAVCHRNSMARAARAVKEKLAREAAEARAKAESDGLRAD